MLRFLRSAILYEYLVNHFLVCPFFLIFHHYIHHFASLCSVSRGVYRFSLGLQKKCILFCFSLVFVSLHLVEFVLQYFVFFQYFRFRFIFYLGSFCEIHSWYSTIFKCGFFTLLVSSSNKYNLFFSYVILSSWYFLLLFLLITVAWYFYLVLFIISHKFLLLLNFVFCLRFLFASSAFPSSSSCSFFFCGLSLCVCVWGCMESMCVCVCFKCVSVCKTFKC